jgi:RNA recognition motif-containing protein
MNPIPIQKSAAEELLAPTKISLASNEESKKVFVGKIPKGVSDDFMERLLRCCGPVTSWKRSTDASGEPKAFGFGEFENIESVFACQKIINNLPLFDGRLQVKAD